MHLRGLNFVWFMYRGDDIQTPEEQEALAPGTLRLRTAIFARRTLGPSLAPLPPVTANTLQGRTATGGHRLASFLSTDSARTEGQSFVPGPGSFPLILFST